MNQLLQTEMQYDDFRDRFGTIAFSFVNSLTVIGELNIINNNK